MNRDNGERPVEIRWRCRKSGCGAPLRHVVAAPGDVQITCSACHGVNDLHIASDLADMRRIDRCPVCDGVEFFVRRDFPQRLGLAIVVVFGLVATWFYYRERIVATFATLAAAVVIDAAIYLFVGPVTVCYRCRAELRGVAYNPEHKTFDLATSEKYG